MGGCAVGALAVTTGAEASAALSAAGVAAALGAARWRVSGGLVCALVGLIALGELPALAAPLFGAAAWLTEPEPAPDKEFNPVVLAAILAYMTTVLTLLVVGQFVSLPPVAATLATLTVLVGMARAGITIVDRLRVSSRQAVTDDLTGLGNRRHLLARLDHAISDTDHEVALLLIDLDGFKELNDTLGHHAGDQVLRQIGPRLQEALRPGDTLARLGGDEFAVVLDPGDEASASAAGLRLRSSLESTFAVGGIRVHIDASIGIALFPEHARDALGLLQRADVAMYEAKRTRTGHEVYLPERDHHSRRRLELLGELRDGLADDQLILHYQPKAEIATGTVRGVEALVRWAHPRRGLLMPTDFLPLADHSGLGRALTAFVLDRALDEIGERRRDGFDLSVAVNLGPADLLDLGLPSEVARMLEKRRFPPSCLRLEVSRGRGDGRPRAHARGAGRAARRSASPPRSTTSAPATSRSATSSSSASTRSRSTARSSCGSPTTRATPRSCTPRSTSAAGSGCAWWPRASRRSRRGTRSRGCPATRRRGSSLGGR